MTSAFNNQEISQEIMLCFHIRGLLNPIRDGGGGGKKAPLPVFPL